MAEDNILSEIYGTKTTDQTPKIEGLFVTRRDWRDYQTLLGLTSEVLRGKKVLNFGCGGSNIKKDLDVWEGISSDVVELDLTFDPSGRHESPFRWLASVPVAFMARIVKPTDIHDKLIHARRKLLGIDGRTAIQANGRTLPFKDNAFDCVLGLWSTYQIPTDAKEQVFRELMRVGRAVHLSPIFKDDFEILNKITKEMGFRIVACNTPFPSDDSGLPFMFSSEAEYDLYAKEHPYPSRVQRPIHDRVEIKTRFGSKHASAVGGKTIVLQKQAK